MFAEDDDDMFAEEAPDVKPAHASATAVPGVSCTYDRREHSLAKVLMDMISSVDQLSESNGVSFGHSCTAGQGTRRQHDG
jgi:hypothetical protein